MVVAPERTPKRQHRFLSRRRRACVALIIALIAPLIVATGLVGEPRRISSASGVARRWSHDGAELYSSHGQMLGHAPDGDPVMALAFADGDYYAPEPPRPPFSTPNPREVIARCE